MKKISILILLVSILIATNIKTYSQEITGIVYGVNDKGKDKLEGVTVKWAELNKGTLTDSDGKFSLSADGVKNKDIIVSYVGYKTDTINTEGKIFIEVTLKNSTTTDVIKVQDEEKSSYVNNDAAKTEVISQNEFKKEACCDLSGCFGKNTSVDVAVTDILTNTKELKVLGLDGSYTQVLIDNMPIMTGLVTKFGVTSIPGTLIDKIMVSKGSNSVIQGYESISGIINVLIKDYTNSDRFMLNGYVNGMLEKQINLNVTNKFNKWNSLLAFQTVQESKRIDHNGDSFLDAPLITRYMVFNKWTMGVPDEDNTTVTIGAKFLNEKRIGGQTNFYEGNEGSSNVYGQTVSFNNLDGYTRISHSFDEKRSLKFYTSGSYFDQLAYYGTTKYNGVQSIFNLSLLYELPLYAKSYLRIGGSYKYQNIKEDITFLQASSKNYAGKYVQKESIPGIYAESSLELIKNKMSVIAGLRFDYHNEYNLITTPRILIKYQPFYETVMRASFGTGFRVPNIFSEYSNLLASSKNIVISEKINPEKTINYGIDILQYFNVGFISGSLNLDYYRTEFSNKMISDYETNPLEVSFHNSNSAWSNIIQVESNINMFKVIDFKLAYKYIDMFYEFGGTKYEQPFNAKHRVVSGLSYTTKDKQWVANFTFQWFGKQKLPSTESYPAEYKRASESDPYATLNFQLSKNFKYVEVYTGVENIFDYVQHHPIISAKNPFSPYFDTSYIWGPTRGREFYAGFRLLFN